MIQVDQHEGSYLSICKHYRAIYDTPCILEDSSKWQQVCQFGFPCLMSVDCGLVSCHRKSGCCTCKYAMSTIHHSFIITIISFPFFFLARFTIICIWGIFDLCLIILVSGWNKTQTVKCVFHVCLSNSIVFQALKSVVLYVILSPYDNEQSDLVHRISTDKKLEEIPKYK